MLNKLLKLSFSNKERTPLEDFTTEIFAGLLRMEKEIRDDFLNNTLGLPYNETYYIKTQQRYLLSGEPDCIVDMVIENDDTLCFIENKVGSEEGVRQLERYGKVLDEYKGSKQNTYLIYCTKHYDPKPYDCHQFKQIRWHDIAKLLKRYENNTFVNEVTKYLKTHNMAQELTFTAEDFITLTNLQNLTNKVYEYLEKVKPSFEEAFGKGINNSLKVDQIKNHNRFIYYKTGIIPAAHDWKSEIKYGFLLHKPEIYIGIWVHKSIDDYKSFVECSKNLSSEFEIGHLEAGTYIELKQNLSIYLNDETADSKIFDWFKEAFTEFRKFIDNTPDLKWKI